MRVETTVEPRTGVGAAADAGDSPGLEVTLAGAVSLRRGDLTVGDRAFSAGQVRLVTALLVLERDGPVAVSSLAHALWPGGAPEHWRVALSGLVGTVRRRLGEVGIPADAVRGEPGRYLVHLPDARVDLEQAHDDLADAQARFGRGDVEAARDLAGRARAVLSRPVLAGVDSPWLDGLHDRLTVQHLDALVLVARCRLALDDRPGSRRAALQALDLDPLREDGWRVLMRVEAGAGNTASSLQAYERCRRVLADELGVDPSAATQQLHRELLEGIPYPGLEEGQGGSGSVPGADATGPEITEPYVGLRPFGADDAPVFHGRDAEVQALVKRLAARGIVAVVGPSGVGKSSLVRAGLLPALLNGAIPESDGWPMLTMAPGSEPVKALAGELAALGSRLDETHAARLLLRPDGLHEAAGVLLDDEHHSSRVLVVVDQFEEAFTLAARDRAERFVTLLTTATGRLDGQVAVVLTLRADFYDEAASLSGLDEVLSRSQFVVPAMVGEQYEAIVLGPARRAGLTLEPGLLGQVLADVAVEPGALPLLQHLLRELWQRRVAEVMTRHVYDDLGGVAGALAHRAEAIFGRLDDDEREVAKRVLLRAVQPGEDAADTRRPVRASELDGIGDGDRVDRVVARLVDGRLLTASHDPGSNERVVELAHEAVIEHWPRLSGWVDEARAHLRTHRQLTAAADEWQRRDRGDDWLLHGRPLDDADGLRDALERGEVAVHLAPLERDLVTTSLQARERAEEAEIARQEHERALERRSRARLRALVVFAAAVAVVAGALWFLADRGARASSVEAMVAGSAAALDEDPQLSLLLALEAHDRWQSARGMSSTGVERALHDAIAAQRVVQWLPGIGELVAVSPDGRMLATVRPDLDPEHGGVLDVRDATTGEVLHSLPGHAETFVTAVFNADGTRLLSGARGPALFVWDPITGERIAELHGPGEATTLMASDFSPDGTLAAGRHVASGAAGARSLVWDLGTGEVVADIPRLVVGLGTDGLGPTESAFSPDGSLLAIAPWSPTPPVVQVVDVVTGQEVSRVMVDGDGVINDVAWSPDGLWLAIGGDQVLVAAAKSGQIHAEMPTQDGLNGLDGLAWTPDSRRLYVGNDSIQVWDPFTNQDPVSTMLIGGNVGSGNNVYLRSGGTRLFVGSLAGDGVRILDVSPAAGAEVAHLPVDGFPSVEFSPDGSRLATDAEPAGVVLWDTDTWIEQATIVLGDGDYTSHLAWGPTGLAVGGTHPSIWDPESGSRILELGSRISWVHWWVPVDFSLDGQHVAFTRNLHPPGDPYEVVVIDADGGELATFTSTPGELHVEDLQFSPEGQRLAVVRYGGLWPMAPTNFGIDFWDWPAGELVRTIDTDALGLAHHPDGRQLATANHSGVPEVWDVSTGDLLRRLPGHEGRNWFVTYSPDGRRVASTGEDGQVLVSDATTGRLEQRLAFPEPGRVSQAAFSPDGETLMAGADEQGVRAWALDLERLVEIAQSRVVRDFTDAECREYLDRDTCPR